MLAGLLGWPQATFAAKVDVDKTAKKLTVERETDTGTQKLALVSSCSL
jgi:electron transfer flavoprotein beta subunit